MKHDQIIGLFAVSTVTEKSTKCFMQMPRIVVIFASRGSELNAVFEFDGQPVPKSTIHRQRVDIYKGQRLYLKHSEHCRRNGRWQRVSSTSVSD